MRITQLKDAARRLFGKRPMRMVVADFSVRTEQIDALVPQIGKMVTFSVSQGCESNGKLVVGKEVPLSSVRADLLKRIRENSTTIEIN